MDPMKLLYGPLSTRMVMSPIPANAEDPGMKERALPDQSRWNQIKDSEVPRRHLAKKPALAFPLNADDLSSLLTFMLIYSEETAISRPVSARPFQMSQRRGPRC